MKKSHNFWSPQKKTKFQRSSWSHCIFSLSKNLSSCGKEISFKCSICEQKFFARPRVYTHVKSVHKIKHNDFKEYDKYVIKIDPAAELAAAIKNIPRSDESEDEESDEEKIKCDNEKCQVEFDSTAGKVLAICLLYFIN